MVWQGLLFKDRPIRAEAYGASLLLTISSGTLVCMVVLRAWMCPTEKPAPGLPALPPFHEDLSPAGILG